MNKLLVVLAALLTLSISTSVYAQHATVVYNYERNYFNENQPLPAESHFLLSGAITEDVTLVGVEIYKPQKRNKPLYATDWKRPAGSDAVLFSLPVNYKLRGNGEYDIKITYMRNLSQAEREYLKVRLFQTLDSYLSSSLQVNRNNIKLLRSSRDMMNDMNTIVEDGLQIYKNRSGLEFDGFSDIVKGKLAQIEDVKLKKGKFLFGKSKKESKALYVQQLINDLEQVVHNETEQYLNSELMTVSDAKWITDYPTGKAPGGLSVNVGYGGVYFDGDFDDMDYDAAPFVGVSLPFGRTAFSSFLGNASLSAGVFLTNMENENGETVTGPIIDRPSYLALGYRLFRFVRFNVGATFLETETSAGDNDLSVRPFVGLSAEINLSVGIGK